MYKNYFHYSSKQKKCYNLIKINCLSVIFVINHLKTKSNNVRKTCLFCHQLYRGQWQRGQLRDNGLVIVFLQFLKF